MEHIKSLTTYIASFVDELVEANVEEVVVSPGSRSTPIAMLMAEHPDIHVHLNIDERSAGFFALGIAKAKKNQWRLYVHPEQLQRIIILQ